MAYTKKKKQRGFPTLSGGLSSFTGVANLVSNLTEPEKFFELEVGEVLDILLTEEDLLERQPNVEDFPDSNFLYIGMCKVRLVNSEQGVPEETLDWAFPLDGNIKTYPLIGEYVIVARYLETRFYSQNVNFLSQINTNSVPGLSSTATIPGNSQSDYSDVDSGETEATDISDNEFTLGEFFKRKRYIRQLKPYEGDITIQGRFGNSIRFGSDISDDSDLQRTGVGDEDGLVDSPNIKMRTGQLTDLDKNTTSEDIKLFEEEKESEGKFQPYVIEDINADGSSFYMTTNEKVPLNRATDPEFFGDNPTYHSGLGKHIISNFNVDYSEPLPKEAPTELDGQQILLCTDRIVFNSKSNGLYSYQNTDTYFSSGNFFVVDAKNGVSVNTAGVVGFKSEKDFELVTNTKTVITSPKIYLGDIRNTEPVVNGVQLVNFLSDMISVIEKLIYPGPAGTLANGVLFAQLKTDLALLEKASFNSQVNFTR